MCLTDGDYQSFGLSFLSDLIEYFQTSYLPEDIYSGGELKDWAEKNGYVKKEESEE